MGVPWGGRAHDHPLFGVRRSVASGNARVIGSVQVTGGHAWGELSGRMFPDEGSVQSHRLLPAYQPRPALFRQRQRSRIDRPEVRAWCEALNLAGSGLFVTQTDAGNAHSAKSPQHRGQSAYGGQGAALVSDEKTRRRRDGCDGSLRCLWITAQAFGGA